MSVLQALVFKIERSRSRRGKHVLYSMVFVYKKREGLFSYTKARYNEEQAKPTYSRGEAKYVSLSLDPGDFAIYVWMVRNFRNTVKGYISVYNSKGQMVYRAKYRNGYVVYSKGDPVFAWLVRLVLDSQKIPVIMTKLGDEK